MRLTEEVVDVYRGCGFGYYSRRTSGSSYSEQLIQPVEEFARGWDAGHLGSYRNILEASRPALRHL